MTVLKTGTVYQGDCLDLMPFIESGSVDAVICDLPYAITRNKWDIAIPAERLWAEYLRVIKPDGVVILTATAKFAAMLIMSQPMLFKYDLIWEKTIASGQLNVDKQPLRNHEQVLVFYAKQPTYNQQYTEGTPYKIKRTGDYDEGCYNGQTASEKTNPGFRHPKSVIEISNPRIKGGIPTQKPVALIEYLIRAYTNPGDTILDNCAGSFTAAVAADNLGRQWICIEKEAAHCEIGLARVNENRLRLGMSPVYTSL